MAIDDNTLYGLTGAQVKELPGKIEAVKGKARVLTSADYNWPTNNPDGVAIWKLDAGIYAAAGGVKTYASTNNSYTTAATYMVSENSNNYRSILVLRGDEAYMRTFRVRAIDGVLDIALDIPVRIVDNLVTNYTGRALSANQGRVLNEKITGLAISGAGAPTTSTVGTVGKLYEDTTNGKLYICTAVSGSTYTWEEVGAGGGSGPTVVQTTGTSATDVMSQNAVTSMVFADPSTKKRICINGNSSASLGDGSVAIGANSFAYSVGSVVIGSLAKTYNSSAISIGPNAYANADRSIALGPNSQTSAIGEMNIGSTLDNAYLNTKYRLLTGLYDPQSDHDAATKGYVDTAVAGAGASAFTTNEWNALWA